MRILYTFLEHDNFDDTDARLLKVVSPARRSRVNRYRFDRDKLLSLYSALLVRFGITEISGIRNRDISFSSGDFGKPCLLSPGYIQFSFSHSGNMAACAFSTAGPVGADTEKIEKPPLEIMSLMFSDTEKALVDSKKDRGEKAFEFYRIWTRKEAYGKYLGTGLSDSLKDVDTLEDPPGLHFETRLINKYCMSLCSKEAHADIKFLELKENEIRDRLWE